MLIASMNPSPSGDFYDPNNLNGDPEHIIRRYLSKISGPLMDRIDLHIEVQPVPYDKLADKREGETSTDIRARVLAARKIQEIRFKGIEGIHSNAQLTPKLVKQYCQIDAAGEALMKNAMEKLGLSARSYGRIFKVARTIADLDNCESIKSQHIAEAINYRSLDREGWLG